MGIQMIRMEKQDISNKYLKDNLYTVGSLNLIIGKGGEGKSVIAMNIAKQLKEAGLVSQVAYLDSDSKGNTAVDLHNYCCDNNLVYVDTSTMLNHTTPTHLEVMKDLLLNHIDPNSVVVIDALSNLAIDVSSNKELLPIMDFFVGITKQKGLTLIILHHSRKADNEALGATAINTRAEAIHLVKDEGTKFKPNKKMTVIKDNSGKLGLGFSVNFTSKNQADSHTFNIDVEFIPMFVDPFESMSKVEKRKAIKENYLLKYAIAYTRHPIYSTQSANLLKGNIIRTINKISATETRIPSDELYIGASFISTELPHLIDTYFEYTTEKQEAGRPLKLVSSMVTATLEKLNLGELPIVIPG